MFGAKTEPFGLPDVTDRESYCTLQNLIYRRNM